MNQLVEILNWQIEAGVDIALEDKPINRFEESERSKAVRTDTSSPSTQKPALRGDSLLARRLAENTPAPTPRTQNITAAVPPDDAMIRSARERAKSAGSIEELREIMDGFEGCNLRLTAKNLVFADGNPQSDIMFVGEAPGRDEDIQGLPFVGRSGQLLDRMLEAISLSRENAYITNVIPWRPPGNRPPTPAETELCLPFIQRHIELVAPRVLVMLGGSSAKTLLNTTEGILRLRGKWQQVTLGERNFDAMATLHPAYLLRQPGQKKLAWQDFLKIRLKLEAK